MTFSKAGYVSKEVTAIMRRGEVDLRDIELAAVVPVNFAITAVDEAGATIPDARSEVRYLGTQGQMNRYDIVVAAWGFRPLILRDTAFAQNSNVDLVARLSAGYEDDFSLDLGWEVDALATSGNWSRGVPEQTTLSGQVAQLGTDVAGDFGDEAYGTDLRGGSAGDFDVDNGQTILRSPVINLLAGEDYRVEFAYFFFNGGGASAPNDTLVVTMTDGFKTVQLFRTTTNADGWQRYSSAPIREAFGLAGFPIDPNEAFDSLRLVVRTGDLGTSGHIVEAMFDDFRLVSAERPTLTADVAAGCAPLAVTYSLPEAFDNLTVDTRGGSAAVVDGANFQVTYADAGIYGLNISYTLAGGDTVRFSYANLVTVTAQPGASFRVTRIDPATFKFTNASASATSVAWDFGDGTTSTEDSPIHAYEQSGDFEVRLVATSVCGADTAAQRLTGIVNDIAAFSAQTGLRIIANPVTDVLTVAYSGTEAVRIDLHDATGRLVLSQKLAGAGRALINVASLASGTYILRAPAVSERGVRVLVAR